MTVWCTNYFSYQYYHDEQSFPFSLCFIHSGGAQNAEMFILVATDCLFLATRCR